jgi:hypothetical protein
MCVLPDGQNLFPAKSVKSDLSFMWSWGFLNKHDTNFNAETDVNFDQNAVNSFG